MTELFTDNFTVNAIDPEGRSFDNIQRIVCSNESGDSQLILDINSQLYEMRQDEYFSLVISQEISTEAPSDSTHWHPGMLQNSTFASKFDYIMYGKVYRYEEDSANHKATVYVSFGGLLMKLTGEQHALSQIPIARNVYLLMREIKS
ncbi:DNA-directed RNA polymerases I, II, and III subunit RPABC3 [Histomonas meleagridis]|uniref:DNA-directed RNA polymerases I II and III subunit RPABC3 n=1 Tax=Histomonas meleagridis TaxID=135588 RepID=UPI0035596F24|nr:DNA-directed RNA polymerases I, II, and III subunit RPABC3 [Histomonas meleagridis]KAH0801671.1 DNA-directed RNA polymerases I II and III subunit RPABC3 [Histomonas meleagridis]